MTPHGEISDAGFEEAKQRYDLPEVQSVDELTAAQTEKRRRRWAKELGLPNDTPLEEIKRVIRERHEREKEDRNKAA
jgi:hypothetical protein